MIGWWAVGGGVTLAGCLVAIPRWGVPGAAGAMAAAFAASMAVPLLRQR